MLSDSDDKENTQQNNIQYMIDSGDSFCDPTLKSD